MGSALYNKVNKELLKERLMAESFRRITLSFYKYYRIDDATTYRDNLYLSLSDLNVFGRVYIAEEGINAQVSVPEHNFENFKTLLNSLGELNGVPLKSAVEDNGKSFYKLIVRLRKKILADGLDDRSFDASKTGNYLDAKAFNEVALDPETIVVDMRNHYETEVGHFKNALCFDADTFREALPKAMEELKGKEDKKIVMYCTGGIRCEKASAYFKHRGFKDVNQLRGGIIEYAHQVTEKNLPSLFIGSNFVFDERLGEHITEDVISECHQCGKPCSKHVNCANNECHLLFIQCDDCAQKFKGTCSSDCSEIASMSMEEQRMLRRGKEARSDARNIYKSRLRPNLKKHIETHPGYLGSVSETD